MVAALAIGVFAAAREEAKGAAGEAIEAAAPSGANGGVAGGAHGEAAEAKAHGVVAAAAAVDTGEDEPNERGEPGTTPALTDECPEAPGEDIGGVNGEAAGEANVATEPAGE